MKRGWHLLCAQPSLGRWCVRVSGGLCTALAISLTAALPVQALEVVLHDVAPDRVERQRRFARGELPLPGTPDLSDLDARLKDKGLAKGRAIYVRLFKAESELELWLQNDGGTFSKLATYPICHWTGSIGPKLKEGDKQSPEGFYSVGIPQTRLVGRWRRAFNLGFPNQHDQLLSRTGSYILVHGGCSSVGCFAMTDQVQNEIYGLATAALKGGQARFQVHIFPFRMTEDNMARFADHDWAHSWADLKPAYDSFERTRVPPMVALCGVRYKVADGLPGETGGVDRRMPVLKPVIGPGRDASAVLTSDGRRQEPPCQFEDEAKRTLGQDAVATGSSATVTTASTALEPEDGEPIVGLEPSSPARPVREGTDAAATGPERASPERSPPPRRPVATRSGRKSAPKPALASEVGSGLEGFGSATLGGKGRLTANGS